MPEKSTSRGDVDARLQRVASDTVHDYGPPIRKLLAQLNVSRLQGRGRLTSAEMGRKAIRWELEWETESITYHLHVAVVLGDDGHKAFVDRVLVQREASVPYHYDGHTPTTMMKQVARFDIKEIEAKLNELWPGPQQGTNAK